MRVRRCCAQQQVLDGSPDSEVIKTLPIVPRQGQTEAGQRNKQQHERGCQSEPAANGLHTFTPHFLSDNLSRFFRSNVQELQKSLILLVVLQIRGVKWFGHPIGTSPKNRDNFTPPITLKNRLRKPLISGLFRPIPAY